VISTRDLTALPSILNLKRLTKSLAVLDAIIMPEWDYRYYSFNSKWSAGQEMASMRNGQGDAWFCVFSEVGVFLKGFDHESQMSPWSTKPPHVWRGVLDEVPDNFNPFATEPAFSMSDTTFCIWRDHNDDAWRKGHIEWPSGEDPDGSAWMLSILDCDPQKYKSWAEDYYERSVDLELISHVYEQRPLADQFVLSLNPERDLKTLAIDVEEIGYPAIPADCG
jgi:hypothetical protein